MATGSRTVLVTGGANGIGAATVRMFADNGDRVVFGDVADDLGTRLADELEAAGQTVMYRHADMTQEVEVAALVTAAVERFGSLDVAANVVGNIGGGDQPGVLLHDQTLEQWNGTVAQSLTSAFLSMKYELAHMIAHGGGSIVNVASLSGLGVATTGTPAYAAAKAAVIHLTRYAAITYAGHNVRVNCVAPSLTLTDHASKAVPNLTEVVAARHAIARAVTPAEQAAAIFWLAGDAAGMITGHTLPVDGGWNAR